MLAARIFADALRARVGLSLGSYLSRHKCRFDMGAQARRRLRHVI
jgi:hypothetical protein